MARLQILLCFAFLVAAVLSSPISLKKRSFTVNRIRQANYVPNGPAALRKAYRKFGFDDISFRPNVLTGEKVDATDATGAVDQQGDVAASPTQNDAEFLSPVVVGGQTIVMDFDTGSSDM